MLIFNKQGFTLLGALITIFVLAVLGTGIAVYTSSNRQATIMQLTSSSSFYSVQAGIEFAQRKLRNDGVILSTITGTFEFGNSTFTIGSGGGNTVTISGARGASATNFSVTIPQLTQGSCLTVNTSGAFINGRNLNGITLQRDGSCSGSITITALTSSWVPNEGENVDLVQIAGNPQEYNNATGTPSGGTATFTNNYTINDGAIHNLTQIRWDVPIGDSDFNFEFSLSDGSTKTFEVNFLANNEANCLVINTAAASIGGTNDRDLLDITLQNTCSSSIIIDRMQISWNLTTPVRVLNRIQIAGAPLEFSGTANSGDDIDINNFTLAATTTYNLTYIRNDDSMLGFNYTIKFTMVDTTTKTANVNLFENNMANCLDVDTSSLSFSANGRDLLGMTLVVSGSCLADILLDKMTLSWDPTTPARLLQIIRIDGTNIWSGSNASGVEADTDNVLFVAGDPAVAVDFFRFNTEMTSVVRTFTLVFTMFDATTKSVTFNPTIQSNCLSIDTSGALLGGIGNDQLQGITLTNTCLVSITIKRIRVSWTPTAPARRINTVRINGSDVWTGNATSGTFLNITDVVITSGSTIPIDYLDFNGSMIGRTFTIIFELFDNTQKTATTGPF